MKKISTTLFLFLLSVGFIYAQCVASYTFINGNAGVVTFNGTCSGTGQISYMWSFGDGSSGTGQSATHTYTANGMYTVCLYAADSFGACANTQMYFCDTVTVSNANGGNPTCSANFILWPDSVTTGLYYGYNTSTGTGTSNYLWSWGDGSTSTGPYPSHTYANSGTYTICLTITTMAGGLLTCTDSTCLSYFIVRQSAANNMHTINILDPNATSIRNLKLNSNLTLSPNPAENLVTLSGMAITGNEKVKVYDQAGREVSVGEAFLNQNKSIQLDIRQLPSGIYTIRVNNGQYSNLRFVKK